MHPETTLVRYWNGDALLANEVFGEDRWEFARMGSLAIRVDGEVELRLGDRIPEELVR